MLVDFEQSIGLSQTIDKEVMAVFLANLIAISGNSVVGE